jgi:hypothetical protein
MRLQWPDGALVVVGFLPKTTAKSMVAVQHTKLPDKAAADRPRRSGRIASIVWDCC